jgi:hypothetical protein
MSPAPPASASRAVAFSPLGRYCRRVIPRPPLSVEAALRRAEEIIARPVDDGALLVHLESGKVWHLNPTGAQLWALIDGQRTLRDIGQQIATTYSIAVEAVERDVLSVAETLIAEGLLVAVP